MKKQNQSKNQIQNYNPCINNSFVSKRINILKDTKTIGSRSILDGSIMQDDSQDLDETPIKKKIPLLSREFENKKHSRNSANKSVNYEKRICSRLDPNRSLILEKRYKSKENKPLIDSQSLLDSTNQDIETLKNDPLKKLVDDYLIEQEKIVSLEEKIDIKADALNLPLLEDKHLLLEEPPALLRAINRELEIESMKSMMDDYMAHQLNGNNIDTNFNGDSTNQKEENNYDNNIPKKTQQLPTEILKKIVEKNLIDDEKRDILLEESLLKDMHTEYLLDKRHRIVNDGLKKLLKTEFVASTNKPMIDLMKPSHIRKNIDDKYDLRSWYSKVHDRNKSAGQSKLLRLAIATNLEKNKLNKERKLNLDTINYILEFKKEHKKRVILFKSKFKKNQNRNSQEFDFGRILRKIFLISSTRDVMQNKNTMNITKFIEMANKIGLSTVLHEKILKTYFDNTTLAYEVKTIDLIEFTVMMEELAKLAYKNTINENSKILNHFLNIHLIPNEKKFILKYEEIVKEPHIMEFLNDKREISKFLYSYFAITYKKPNQKQNSSNNQDDDMLSLEKVYEMFTKIGLFPGKCEKSVIRYYFEYCQPDDLGLDYDDFTLFLPILGLHTIETIKKVAENMSKNGKLQEKILKYELKTPLDMIEHFYTNPDYLGGDTQILKNRIKMIDLDSMKNRHDAKEKKYVKNNFNENVINVIGSNK